MDIIKNISFILDIYLKNIQPVIIDNYHNILKKYPKIKNFVRYNKQEFKNTINSFKRNNNYTLEEYCYIKKIFLCFSKITSESLVFKLLCLKYIKIIKNLLLIIKYKNKTIADLKNDINLLKQLHNQKNIDLLMSKLTTIDEIDEIEEIK